MMDEQDHARDLVAAYVLGAVTPDEATLVEEHLATCALCRRLESELREVQATLPYLVEERMPPPALKGRVMAIITAEAQQRASGTPRAAVEPPDAPPQGPRRMAPPPPPPQSPARARSWRTRSAARWYPLLAVAAVLVLLVIGAGVWYAVGTGPSQPTRTYAMSGTVAQPTIHGTLRYYKDGNRAVLDLHGLKSIPANRVYELWLIHGKSAPKGVTVFRPGANGSTRLTLRGQDVPAYTLAALTMERAPGSATPHLPLVATATL